MRFILLILVVSLSGCDAFKNNASEIAITNEPTIVIEPGFNVVINGQSVPVSGFDRCPNSDDVAHSSCIVSGLMFNPGYKINVNGVAVPIIGSDKCSKAGEHDCVVLLKDRTDVAVQVGLPTGSVVEKWVIIRETGKSKSGRPYSRTSLRRPDGSLVIPAANS